MLRLPNLEAIDIAATFKNGGSSSFFPSLTDLRISNCPNLFGFVKCKSGVGMRPLPASIEELPCFPCLFMLEIGVCSNLRCMPNFPKLKRLELREGGVESLKELLEKTASTSSPLSFLSQLEHLTVYGMADFPEDELLQYLTSLQRLNFQFCEFKTVGSDDKDGGVQWKSLQALTSVDFFSMHDLVSIPKGLQYVPTLQSLLFCYCRNLVGIPEWMTDLTSLQHLTIIRCHQLSKRCNNNLAEDWLKISHIPNIFVDDRTIQRNGCYML